MDEKKIYYLHTVYGIDYVGTGAQIRAMALTEGLNIEENDVGQDIKITVVDPSDNEVMGDIYEFNEPKPTNVIVL